MRNIGTVISNDKGSLLIYESINLSFFTYSLKKILLEIDDLRVQMGIISLLPKPIETFGFDIFNMTQ